MVILKKMLLPLIKKYLRLFISMVIISAMGIAATVGLIGVTTNLSKGVNDYINEYGYQDILIDINPTNKSLDDLIQLDSVKRIDTRLFMDVSVKLYKKTLTARMFTYKSSDFKKFYVRDEIYSGIGIPISIDWHYAIGNDIKVGDTFNVLTMGHEIPVYCKRIVSSPECISIKQNRYIYGESTDYGYFYVDEADIHDKLEGLGYGNYYNELQILTTKEKSNLETYNDIKAVMKDDFEVIDYTLFEESLVKSSIDINIPTLEQLSKIVPVLFFIITMLVIFLFMCQILNQERKNIGIYKALGFTNKEILPLFLAIGFIVSLAAFILGIIIGYAIEYFMMNLYFDIFQMPWFLPNIPWGMLFVFGSINSFVCILAAFLSTYPLFNVEPKEAMMVQGSNIRDPKTIKRLHLPLSVKLSISIIVRNILRFLFSSLCISTAIVMLYSGFLLANSGNITIDQTYNKRFNFDCIVYYKAPLTTEVIEAYEKNSNIKDFQIAEYTVVELDPEYRFVLLGLEDSQMMRVIGFDGNTIIDLDDGIVLSTRVAERLNVKVGDSITIRGKDVRVSNISRQYVSAICYMKKDKMIEYGLSSYETILANINSKDSMNTFVVSTKDYLSVEYKANLYDYTMKCYDNIRPAIYLLIAIAIIIGSVVIYNISQINLMESSQEIAIMKSIGVRQSYIERTWLVESLLKYVIASIIGIPIGSLIGKFVLAKMKSRLWEYPYQFSFPHVLLTLAITIIFVLFSHLLSMRRIEKWNLADLCRAKE